MKQEQLLLAVKDLRTYFFLDEGTVRSVDGVDFNLWRGQTLGVVGESGCGKSVTALSILRLLPTPPAQIEGGRIELRGKDLLRLSEREMQDVRGNEISMIFQEPMTSLNPVYTVGTQIVEAIRAHEDVGKQAARRRTVELLRQVGIPHATERFDDFPHEFSGGMRQRAMIAMALACNPDVLIADEPTTALDVTIQAQILELISRLKDEFGSSVIMITHDLGVVADIADEILVMYAGRVVEEAPKRDLFHDPQHPYTWGLLQSIPRLDRPKLRRLASIPGTPPSLIDLPQGCKFGPRCPHRFEKCVEEPGLEDRLGSGGAHVDRCWLSVETKRARGREAVAGSEEEAA